MTRKTQKQNESQLEKIVIERTQKIIGLQKRIEFILGATKTGLDIIDKNFNVVYIDPEWKKVYGDPTGKKCYEYFMGRDKTCQRCGIKKAFATKLPVVTEEVLAREGNRTIQVTTIPYKDENGEWLVAEVNADITEHKKIEQALRDSERQIREITDMLPVVVYQYQFMPDGTQKFIFVNKATKNIFGLRQDEILKDFSKAWSKILPEDAPLVFESIKKAVEEFKPWAHDFRLRKKNRKVVWIQGRSIPKKIEPDGSVIFYGTLTDVTEHKTQEVQLEKYRQHLESIVKERTKKLALSESYYRELFKFAKESEEKFKAIFSKARDGFLLADPITRRFYMANKTMCQMLGYSEKEMVRLAVDNIHPKENLSDIIEKFEEQARGDISLITNVPVQKKNGAVIYADINTAQIFLKGKRYILGSFRDITERRKIEAALQMSEDNYRSIFETASDAILIRDIQTYKTIDANRAACEMFGYSKEDMKKLYIKHFMTDETGYTWKEAENFYKLAADGEPQLFEWLGIDKAGRYFWVEANVKRAVIGGKYRIISMLRDITERKRLVTMKDNFMNTVSHELRTPLAAIKEGISIVVDELEGEVGSENKNILNVVKKNVDRLNRLIDDVLDFQKLESGKMPFRLKKHNINEVVEECCQVMGGLVREKKLSLTLDLDKSIPSLSFDKDKILQVLLNFINNAVKFTEQGNITIVTRSEGKWIKVCVRDTGIGIKPEDLPRMFKKFERIESATGQNTGGTGLGLPISKEIIEKHGGRIWVESRWQEGSEFYFTLPLNKKNGVKNAEKNTYS
ncbi:MAG: PAS domain S-box protein [Candidatus Omnitrophota bacterium]